MCVVSMIMDHYDDSWYKKYYIPTAPYLPVTTPQIPQIEIDEFKKLLERAREYDKKHDQPNCELESKRQKLLEMARDLGVEINFI